MERGQYHFAGEPRRLHWRARRKTVLANSRRRGSFPYPANSEPLDGSRIVAGVLPSGLARQFFRLEPYGMLIFLSEHFLYCRSSVCALV